jgi:hypothetical protein
MPVEGCITHTGREGHFIFYKQHMWIIGSVLESGSAVGQLFAVALGLQHPLPQLGGMQKQAPAY